MSSISLLTATTFILCSSLLLATSVFNQSHLLVTYHDVNLILSQLHQIWPPLSTPPPSDIHGLTADNCSGTADCLAPRVCFSCPSPPCLCMKSPIFPRYGCKSSHDCDEGEYCGWDPVAGLTTGRCITSRYFPTQKRSILQQPITSIPPLLGSGLTGDRCFSHSDCRGTRSCLSKAFFNTEVYNLTACEYSQSPCVCTPIDFIPCFTTSDCTDQGEMCTTVLFSPSSSFPNRFQTEQDAVLEPICISSNLTHTSTAVLPVSNNSEVRQIRDLPRAQLQPRSFEESGNLQPARRLSADVPPFSVPELSFFNAFSTDDLQNDFIGGILSLVIVSQLHNIIQTLIHSVAGVSEDAYSAYIIFSRLSSFRYVSRLIRLQEPYPRQGDLTSFRKGNRISVSRIFRPLLAITILFVAEFATIIAGTDSRKNYFADQNFDPVVAAVNGTRAPRIQDRFNHNCDDFFVPTRGLFESGKVLKCVNAFPMEPELSAKNLIAVHVLYGSGKTIFSMHSENGSFGAVELSTSVRAESGESLKTMPFRPDLMNQFERITFLNSILNGIRSRLGYKVEDIRRNLWGADEVTGPSGQLESLTFGHRTDWKESLETITNAVTQGLRELDLVLNSTGEPWVFTKPFAFERRNPLMAVVKPYRIPHGWLSIIALFVTAVHFIVNTFATAFDDVAYLAMKELLGEDCVLGPLAEGDGGDRIVEL